MMVVKSPRIDLSLHMMFFLNKAKTNVLFKNINVQIRYMIVKI